jgi:hypothetical protein
MFSDEPSVHNSKHAHCKHCKQSVALHCKVEKAKQHLLSCLPFGRAMARADSAERPDWWMNKTAKSSISSSARNATTSQADIRNFAIPALKPSEGRELDKLVAMHIYTTGSAFQRVEDPYLHKAFNLCRPGVRLPTRQRLGGELLDACYKEIKKEVDRSLQAAHRCCCITSDAWSNISNEPVVNYMAIMREKSLFVEAVNTGAQGHDAAWIAGDMARVIDALGCEVGGAVTDNTSANRKAWAMLKEKFPAKFFHGCASHGIHLLCKSIFYATKLETAGGGEKRYPAGYPFEYLLLFAAECKELVLFCNNHHVLKAKLTAAQSASSLKALVAPAPTRWGSLKAMFETLLASDACINAIVAERGFIAGSSKQKLQRTRIQGIVQSPNFIGYLDKSIAILAPLDALIVRFQNDQAPVSEVYQGFLALPEKFKDIKDLTEEETEYLGQLSRERFEFMCGEAHGLGNLLDPRFLGGGMPPGRLADIKQILINFPGEDGSSCPERKRRIYLDFQDFLITALDARRLGGFEYQMLMQGETTPLQYWLQNTTYKTLAPIAVKIFSMAASSAASERNFSTFGFIHSKLRNRLGADKVKKLVYIKTNAVQVKNAMTPAGCQSKEEEEEEEGQEGQEGQEESGAE